MAQQIGWSVEAKLMADVRALLANGFTSFKPFPSLASFPTPGGFGMIYLAMDTNMIYYWDEALSTYVLMSGNPASVVLYPTFAAFPPVGSDGVVYITQDTDKIYYWDSILLAYVELSASISTLNGLSAASQTFATGTAGVDFGISSVGSVHTFNIPTASGTNRGLLSTGDWTTFNNKVSTSRTISTNAPLQGGGDLSADRTLSITQASSSTDGYLSAADYRRLNISSNTANLFNYYNFI